MLANEIKKISIASILIICTGLLGFFIERHEGAILIPVFVIAFGIYWYLYTSEESYTLKELIVVGIICRLLLIPSIPALSDDVYRFIWDGRLFNSGISPFAAIPTYYLSLNTALPGIDAPLFEQLNSPSYYSVYPPIAQFIFYVSVLPFPTNTIGSIILIRLMSIIAEFGTIYFLFKVLNHLQLPRRNAMLYFINPLVIMELTGNLHFESFMLLFLIAGIYFLLQKKPVLSGLFWALAIGTKLIPLIFLPLILLRFSFKQNLYFFTAMLLTLIVIFIPFINASIVSGFSESLPLYFNHFEFNASLYYLVREVGYFIKGYNIIGTAGKFLAILSFLSIIMITIIGWKKKWNITPLLVVIIFIYFLFTNILHPWYITSILLLSILTKFRFTVVWTALIVLTYIGYTATDYQENLWIVGIEYLIVIGTFLYEIQTKNVFKTTLT